METTDPWADWLKEYEEMQQAKQASVPKSYVVPRGSRDSKFVYDVEK
jgi:hypothetical protein